MSTIKTKRDLANENARIHRSRLGVYGNRGYDDSDIKFCIPQYVRDQLFNTLSGADFQVFNEALRDTVRGAIANAYKCGKKEAEEQDRHAAKQLGYQEAMSEVRRFIDNGCDC